MLTRLLSRSFASGFLSTESISSYEQQGFIILRNALPSHITSNLERWATELENLPETPGKWMKYFEVDQQTRERVLCRVENFLPYFSELEEVSRGFILDLATQLFNEPASIYKEKLNFKFPKGAGFTAHQDQPAFASFGIDKLLTVLLPVDPNTRVSGGIDVVSRVHSERVVYSQNTDGSIRTDLEARMNWIPVDVHAGDIVIFDSYTPHRSDVNQSDFCRRNIYLTYNPLSLGSFREYYYQEKRKSFPPDCERDPSKDYSEGAKVFNVANPIK